MRRILSINDEIRSAVVRSLLDSDVDSETCLMKTRNKEEEARLYGSICDAEALGTITIISYCSESESLTLKKVVNDVA